VFKTPEGKEQEAIKKLVSQLLQQDDAVSDANAYQNIVYAVGMEFGFEIKDWFKALYQILLGQDSGPRLGSFIKIFGRDNFIALCNAI
jgi:lysyl-tRNA synthetase class 1